MAIPSPVGDVKIVSTIITFVLKYIDTQIKCFFLSIDPREGINDFAFTLQTSGRDIPSIDLELYSST